MGNINKDNDKKRGVYIHIPFCARKCTYCDFNSKTPGVGEIDKYIEYLEKEIKLYSTGTEKIETVFIGGGTPSILSASQLKKLLDIVNNHFVIDENIEFSIECNPGTLNKEKLVVMKENGVNRLSMGLQSTKDEHLEFMGRIHRLKEFEESFDMARKVGFDNINVDLIYAFYGQSMEDWKETLEYIVKKNPEHISAYSLILEEGTELYRLMEKGDISQYNEDEFVKMFEYTPEFLKKYGYFQYEISNYAKKGKNCRHNLIYWDCKEYYGFGLGASGYIDGVRYTNIGEIKKYFKAIDKIYDCNNCRQILNMQSFVEKKLDKPENCLNLNMESYQKNTEKTRYDFSENTIKIQECTPETIEFTELLSDIDKFNEYIFLGLRKNEGIHLSELKKLVGSDKYEKIERKIENELKKGNIKKENEKIFLTNKGRKIANSVFVELML